MGQRAAVLLVRRAGFALAALALLAGCHRASVGAGGQRVDARAFDAFYLWPGVHPPAGVRPRVLYLLDGEVQRYGAAKFTRLRSGVPHLPGEIWLVVRVERLDWSPEVTAQIMGDLARWQAAGNHVAGLQIDFDASTRGITHYAAFLGGLRRQLPRGLRLSITGLMDWSAHGDPKTLAGLGQVVDEVVVQTYQGRDTIPGYGAYFARMGRFPIPFRVALAEGGAWEAPPMLAKQAMFRGYVVFLMRGRVAGRIGR